MKPWRQLLAYTVALSCTAQTPRAILDVPPGEVQLRNKVDWSGNPRHYGIRRFDPIRVRITIDSEGWPIEVCAVGYRGHPAILRDVIKMLRQWRWEPYLHHGKPRTVRFPLLIDLRLK